jgi:hypothetical protein
MVMRGNEANRETGQASIVNDQIAAGPGAYGISLGKLGCNIKLQVTSVTGSIAAVTNR